MLLGNRPSRPERRRAVDRSEPVAAERDVEFTGLIEPAQSVEAGSIQVVEEEGRFGALAQPAVEELVEARAMCVEQPLVVVHWNRHAQPALLSEQLNNCFLARSVTPIVHNVPWIPARVS